jgi:serine/threonine-protein kinase
MGAILRGRDADLGRELAIKVLLEKHRDQPELVRRFIEEAQIGGQLQHPGIVPVYELGRFEDRRPYFAMKLIEGRTLAALLHERDAHPAPSHGGAGSGRVGAGSGRREEVREAEPPPTGTSAVAASADLPQLLGIFEQVCQTMAYAHARGVIHRDLKPANIMVGAFGEVQVMDWGLAKVLTGNGGAAESSARPDPEAAAVRLLRNGSAVDDSQAGSVLGTPAYMAPEQARGDLAAVDERADVFGLGAILCEILTGLPPYVGAGGDRGELRGLAARAELDGALIRLEACGADPDLVALCRRCLAPGPGDRPRDAGAVAAAITSHRRGLQDRLRQAELARVEAQAKAAEERKRRRLTIGLAAAVVGLFATAGGGGAWLAQQRQARAAQVDLALHDLELLELQAEAADDDPTTWAAASQAALRAEQLLDDARDAATRARVAGRVAEVRARAEAARRDARLLDRLAEIRDAKEEVPAAQTEAAYAAAFRAAHLDLEGQPPVAAGRALARRPARVAVALAVTLDHWAALRRGRGDCPGAERLSAAARAADPDDWRGRLRAAVAGCHREETRAALAELARSAPAADLPPITLAMLGAALLRAGDANAAEALLRPAQRRHPNDVWLALLLGQALEKLARAPEAIRYYMMARALRPQSAHRLAHALSFHGETEEAVAVFRDLIRLSPANPRHHVCLAETLRSRGRAREADQTVDAAIAAARDAIRLDPDDPGLHTVLGIALDERGQPDQAIAEYREVIRLRPDDASAHAHLGHTLGKEGHDQEAIAELRAAIRLLPDDHQAHLFLGQVLDHQGRPDEAIAELRTAIRLQPDHAVPHFNLGHTLFHQGRVDEALAEYREAVRLQPDNAAALCNLGAILCDFKRDYGAAIASFRAAIRYQPGDVTAHYNLGNALVQSRRLEEAIAAYRAAIRLRPDHAHLHYVLGLTLADQGKHEPAIAAYREAIRLRPGLAHVHYHLGNALVGAGRSDAAITEYRETIRLKPDFAEPHCNLAQQLRRQGRYAESLAEFERGHELGRKHPGWSYPSGRWVEQARRLARIEARIPALLRGEAAPADALERLDLARAAHAGELYVMAARLAREAFAADPKLAGDLEGGSRYDAACSAAMAGCGRGRDRPPPDAPARSALRRQALDWLTADVAAWSKVPAAGPSRAGQSARHWVAHYRHDPELAGVREPDDLAKLPEAERAAWQALWAEVDRLLATSRDGSR